MDPISHLAVGSAVAALTPAGIHPAVIWGVLIGAQFPDSDVVIRWFRGRSTYMTYHRGPSHGLVVQFVSAALIATFLMLFFRSAPSGQVYFWTLLGCFSHLLFDITNDYGTQVFYPFSRRWIALDLLPLIDVYVLGTVAVGWLVVLFSALTRQQVFPLVWLVMMLYVVARFSLHERAFKLVEQRFDLTQPCTDHAPCGEHWPEERLSVHPMMFSIGRWRYLARQTGMYLVGTVEPLRKQVGAPQVAHNQYDQIVAASLQSPLATQFTSWVRRPRTQVDPLPDGRYRVRWSDMLYRVHSSPMVTVYLDRDLKLLDEAYGNKSPEKIDDKKVHRHVIGEREKEETDGPNVTRL